MCKLSSNLTNLLFLIVLTALMLIGLRNGNAQTCGRYCTVHDHGKAGKLNLDSVSGGNYCSEFSACSINRDLSGATGEELQRYTEEKAQDGHTYSDWLAPDFTLPTTDGERVSLSDYRGSPVVLIFMSGHCSHCLDTLPILAELKDKYKSQGLVILPVYINSGSVQDVKTWSERLSLNFPLLVSRTRDISRVYGSQMVPSFFLIDRKGRITTKFVGYKNKAVLDKAFKELVNLVG